MSPQHSDIVQQNKAVEQDFREEEDDGNVYNDDESVANSPPLPKVPKILPARRLVEVID